MFYLGTLLRTVAQETTSQVGLRNCSEEVREKPGFVGVFFWGKARGVVEHEKNTGNHKKQMSETNDFCSFLCLSALFFSDVAGFLFYYFLSV